jgi:gamma-glutamyltranspeptidase / glutathione hydrolase
MITSRPEIVGTFGVVASTHWLATSTAMAILEKGGNAFDAAAAAGFVLQVVEPDQNGPGGDLPIILWSARRKKVEVICGQGCAPAKADIAAVRGQGLEIMPGTGHLPAVVPGAFDAWMLLLRDYGTMHLRDILMPAMELARNGFCVKPNLAAVLGRVGPFFKEFWPSSLETFLPRGDAPAAGSLYRLPVQANTYERIIRESERAGRGREAQINVARCAWYQGFVAEAIDDFFRRPVMDTSGEAHAGLLTGEDLARWQATVEEPLVYRYREYDVHKPGPWAQSPVLLQQLALLKGFELDAMDPGGADFVHTVQECAKLAYADREAFYGDPLHVDVPLTRLLSDSYNDARRKLVSSSEASMELRPGKIAGFGGAVRERSTGSTTAMFPDLLAQEHTGGADPRWEDFMAESHGDTCHVDIIDRWGNMVSATPSGGWLSGSPAVPGLGFSISVRGQIFSLDEDQSNSLAPGKRPRTTLTPTLAFKSGEPYMAFGTPGGDQQDQWALHAFLRHAHYGLNLQEAVDAPSFHTEHFPSSFYPKESKPGSLSIEVGFGKATLKELERRGHRLVLADKWEHYNSVMMATRTAGLLRASASPRRMQSYAIGR